MIFMTGDYVEYDGKICTIMNYNTLTGLYAVYAIDTSVVYPGIKEWELVYAFPSMPPVLAPPLTIQFKVGEYVWFQGTKAKVVRIINSNGRDEPKYEVETGYGNSFEALESELAPILYSGDTKIEKVKQTNGCECGAWSTQWKNDHMWFCPKFKG